MTLTNLKIAVSAITAFCISAGGAIVAVIGSGNTLNSRAVFLAIAFGVTSAAKDTRSLLALPPINGDGKPPTAS